MSSPRIGIFVATMTGLAGLCAEEAAAALSGLDYGSTTHLMETVDAGALDDVDLIVVISSTYGHGDIPDNGQALYDGITALPSLTGKDYAVFALGDRTYAATFCHGGEAWDRLLAEKGARRVAPLERHDASAGTLAEDIAGEWAGTWAMGWEPQTRLAA